MDGGGGTPWISLYGTAQEDKGRDSSNKKTEENPGPEIKTYNGVRKSYN